MQFKEYSSIKNESGIQTKALSKANLINDECEYIATEKIHGCNFSFVIWDDFDIEFDIVFNNDGNLECLPKITEKISIQCAKRHSLIEKNEDFYSYENVRDMYIGDIKKIFDLAKLKYENVTQVQIYGELYGGVYNHCDVKSVRGTTKIQSGIHYCPHNDFIVFDILINNTLFIKYDSISDFICKCSVLKCVPVIYRGKYSELIKLDPIFQSQIYKLHGLPEIKNNFAEGYVIKLNRDHDATTKKMVIITAEGQSKEIIIPNHRGVVKLKHPNFSEVHTGQKPKIDTNNKKTIDKHVEMVFPYLTKNRFDGVISKLGNNAIKHKKIGYFVTDAMKDFIETIEDVDTKEIINNKHKKIYGSLVTYVELNYDSFES
jgi:Rnl2 family RNA ligase